MIVKSKTPLLYDALENKKGVISPEIQKVCKNLKSGNYEVTIFDRLEVARENPEPGTPLYSYQFLRKREKTYAPEVINQLFKQFGQTINPADEDYDGKNTAVYTPGLHFISCTTSIYGSEIVSPEDFAQGLGAFEMVPEEMAPEPEPEPEI